jgi:hypothetical protein
MRSVWLAGGFFQKRVQIAGTLPIFRLDKPASLRGKDNLADTFCLLAMPTSPLLQVK